MKLLPLLSALGAALLFSSARARWVPYKTGCPNQCQNRLWKAIDDCRIRAPACGPAGKRRQCVVHPCERPGAAVKRWQCGCPKPDTPKPKPQPKKKGKGKAKKKKKNKKKKKKKKKRNVAPPGPRLACPNACRRRNWWGRRRVRFECLARRCRRGPGGMCRVMQCRLASGGTGVKCGCPRRGAGKAAPKRGGKKRTAAVSAAKKKAGKKKGAAKKKRAP